MTMVAAELYKSIFDAGLECCKVLDSVLCAALSEQVWRRIRGREK